MVPNTDHDWDEELCWSCLVHQSTDAAINGERATAIPGVCADHADHLLTPLVSPTKSTDGSLRCDFQCLVQTTTRRPMEQTDPVKTPAWCGDSGSGLRPIRGEYSTLILSMRGIAKVG